MVKEVNCYNVNGGVIEPVIDVADSDDIGEYNYENYLGLGKIAKMGPFDLGTAIAFDMHTRVENGIVIYNMCGKEISRPLNSFDIDTQNKILKAQASKKKETEEEWNKWVLIN